MKKQNEKIFHFEIFCFRILIIRKSPGGKTKNPRAANRSGVDYIIRFYYFLIESCKAFRQICHAEDSSSA